MTNREKFLALVSKEETKTVSRAKERIAKKTFLRLSHFLAIKIITRLDELGWKQNELAKKMEVSPQQVSKWVKGGENFTLETIAKLSDVLGVALVDVPLSIPSQTVTLETGTTQEKIENWDETEFRANTLSQVVNYEELILTAI